jgi:hypothetical protein
VGPDQEALIMKTKKTIIFTFLILSCLYTYSQFYKVYGYQPAEAGEIELVIWNSYIPSSNVLYDYFGEELSREGLLAHSLELEYGLSNRFGVALYFDFEDPKGGNFRFVRTKAIMAHYALFDKGSRPVDIAIYLEYIIHNKDYKDYEELEIRLILEKDIGAFRIDVNPIFEKKTSGSTVDEGLEFNYAVGFYYQPDGEGMLLTKNLTIRPGLEFYGKMGEISDFKPWKEQHHYIFPTLDFLIGNRLHWHTGVGFGLTDASDKITIKSILSFILKF